MQNIYILAGALISYSTDFGATSFDAQWRTFIRIIFISFYLPPWRILQPIHENTIFPHIFGPMHFIIGWGLQPDCTIWAVCVTPLQKSAIFAKNAKYQPKISQWFIILSISYNFWIKVYHSASNDAKVKPLLLRPGPLQKSAIFAKNTKISQKLADNSFFRQLVIISE